MTTFRDSKGVLFTFYDSKHAIVVTNTSSYCNAISSSSNLEEYDIPSIIEGHEVTAVGEAAFRLYGKFVRITIPSTVTAIYDFAFDTCLNRSGIFEKISLPPNIVHYGCICFSGCCLRKAFVSSSVKTMGYSPFGHVSNIKFIEVSKDNQYFANDHQGALYNKDYSRLITVPCLLKKYSIPMTVKTIGTRCFAGSRISVIDISSHVASVKNYAFRNCNNLKTVIIRGNATYFENEILVQDGGSLAIYYFGSIKVSVKLANDLVAVKAYVCSFYEGDTFSGFETNKLDICLPPSSIKITCRNNRNNHFILSYILLIYS